MGQYSSITRTGKHEPFGLHVKRGYVQGHEHVHKFGFNTSVTTSATLVWNGGGGLYGRVPVICMGGAAVVCTAEERLRSHYAVVVLQADEGPSV